MDTTTTTPVTRESLTLGAEVTTGKAGAVWTVSEITPWYIFLTRQALTDRGNVRVTTRTLRDRDLPNYRFAN